VRWRRGGSWIGTYGTTIMKVSVSIHAASARDYFRSKGTYSGNATTWTVSTYGNIPGNGSLIVGGSRPQSFTYSSLDTAVTSNTVTIIVVP
jgi:hypothetical protein